MANEPVHEQLAADGASLLGFADFMLQGLLHVGDPKPEQEAEAG
jgi:hypothetical protein